ncbi:MAG: phosphotransferase [Anaerolineae bacterium]|nr:phosphotransferase [Anaerolineae bacterium]
MIDNLLRQELGKRWYSNTTPLTCFFAAEYGPRMIEHLRLKLRPALPDTLWPVEVPPGSISHYRRIEIQNIPQQHEAIQPGTPVFIEGLVVKRVKHGEARLEDAERQGVVVGVKFEPGRYTPEKLAVGSVVGVCGEVVYNRRGRMEQIVKAIFPEAVFNVNNKFIKLAAASPEYPDPLWGYPDILSKTLEGKQSYVHGDLHLHNVLIDEWGKGWLIDFALVGKHHNIFDFIKLETSLRLMQLATGNATFSIEEYIEFEEALVASTLSGNRLNPPADPHLLAAYEIILTIRNIASSYMAQAPNFLNEYFPALFLYCLSVMKYYQPHLPRPTRLAFITASVLMRYLDDAAAPKAGYLLDKR